MLVSYPRTYPFVNVESYVLGAVLEYVYFSATLKRYDYIAPALSTTASDDAFSRQNTSVWHVSSCCHLLEEKLLSVTLHCWSGRMRYPASYHSNNHFSYLLYKSCSYFSRLFYVNYYYLSTCRNSTFKN